MGSEEDARIEPRDTYLVINKIGKNVKMAANAERGFKTVAIPTADATPLPPLNPAKIGQLCPKMMAIPHIGIRMALFELISSMSIR